MGSVVLGVAGAAAVPTRTVFGSAGGGSWPPFKNQAREVQEEETGCRGSRTAGEIEEQQQAEKKDKNKSDPGLSVLSPAGVVDGDDAGAAWRKSWDEGLKNENQAIEAPSSCPLLSLVKENNQNKGLN